MRVIPLLFARRREIERLFSVTASAFACPVPPARLRGAHGRLKEYARFTREQAQKAVADGGFRAVIERRLFRGAFQLGARLRRRLRVRTADEARRAARLVYRGLGIDFRAAEDGTVLIRRCRFSETYSSEICALMSAMDCGLLAGLAYYRELCFDGRITEGLPACTACLVRRAGWGA